MIDGIPLYLNAVHVFLNVGRPPDIASQIGLEAERD